jgi:hypothetical protein
VASPIFPTGEFYSLPIPDDGAPKSYGDIRAGNYDLGTLVNDLTRARVVPSQRAHLDPDLRHESIARKPGWRPLFGQADAAEGHLRRQGVAEGDLFLFFGWFREVVQMAGRYVYLRQAPHRHVIFGWLQIEKRICLDGACVTPDWASDHPHIDCEESLPLNTLYVATKKLVLPGIETNVRGGGTFDRYHDALCLTAEGSSRRSVWRLPKCFYPDGKNSVLSYHSQLHRWSMQEDHVLLQSAFRGQEFVLDCDEYPEALAWLAGLFARRVSSTGLQDFSG